MNTCAQIPNKAISFRMKPFATSNPSTVVNMPGVVNKKEIVIRNMIDPKRPAMKLNLFEKS
jgi:hypothetical protein